MVKNKKEFFCECDATVVSTSSSSAKSANLVIPLIWNSATTICNGGCERLRSLTFIRQHRSVVLWRGCCLWGPRPAGRPCLRSADSTAGALQLPGTPGKQSQTYMVSLSDKPPFKWFITLLTVNKSLLMRLCCKIRILLYFYFAV